jgi:drug/metabolite transporter (DMT)-like permease
MSFGGLGIKYCSFGPWQLAGARALFAAATMYALCPRSRVRWSPGVVAGGLCVTGAYVFFVWGNKTTTAANTIFIESSAPLWVLLFSPLVLGEPIRLRDSVTVAAMAAGLVLFFAAPEKATLLSPEINWGNLLALGAALSFTGEVFALRALRRGGAEATVVAGNIFTFVVCGVAMLATPGGFTRGTGADWLVVAALGSVQVAVAYIFYARGMRDIPATRTTLIGMIEPILNPIWVFLVFPAEKPGPWALLGGAVILAGVAYQALAGGRRA